MRWCAHRVQRPHEKINHALVLGGKQGIGKDTLLEPVKHAVGAWNFNEVSPQQVLGRFNGFLKSVILRVSEARDLGEFDRFAFYDHMKSHHRGAARRAAGRREEPHEYAIPNVCGVIITTNHKTDGIYPAGRRSPPFRRLVRPRQERLRRRPTGTSSGNGTAAAGSMSSRTTCTTSTSPAFNPKAPPPQTEAFCEIVNASRSPEDAELADALDRLAEQSKDYPADDRHVTDKRQFWPTIVTVADVVAASSNGEFNQWITDRKNSRKIPHRFEGCGYTPVRNPDADSGLWRLNGHRQALYGRLTVAFGDRLKTAFNRVQGKQWQ